MTKKNLSVTKIILDDIFKHNLLNSTNFVEIFELVCKTFSVEYIHLFQDYDIPNKILNNEFRYVCMHDNFEMAKTLKYTYPQIKHKNVYWYSHDTDLNKWLKNDCVEIYTNIKSARKN